MRAAIVCVSLLAGVAWAQQSPSYRLEEHVVNAGGHPDQGVALSSASFRVRLDAVGEGVAGVGMSGVSFRLDSGFVPAYPPPGEVSGLRFDDHQTMAWAPERSVGDYNVYRDVVSSLPSLGFGTCLEADVAVETAVDATAPALGAAFFYLVTAENRLDEEGTKGFQSNGSERGNPAPCP